MSLFNAIVVGLKEIWAHKFRSLLTMLGIILGVSSLIAMSALVEGMERGSREALIAVGGVEKVRIEAQPVPVEQRNLRDFATGVTLSDVYALQRSAPEVLTVSPEMRLEPQPTLSANGKIYRTWNIAGVWPVQAQVMEHTIEHGRMFTAYDDELARSVCVIGTGVRDGLFGSPEETGQDINPVGQTMNIGGSPFTIIGMFQHYESEQDRKIREIRLAEEAQKRALGLTNRVSGPRRSRGWNGNRGGSFAFRMKNNTVYLPLNSAWIKLRSGQTNLPPEPRLSEMEIKIRDISKLDLALTEIRNIMMVRHRGIEDFALRTQEDWAEQINTFIHNARLSGGLIAGISLLVGGIGIMNIMLASISERIREIGIRKAVGAGGLDIFTQIVVESTVIAFVGGLTGLVTSYGLIHLIVSFTPTDNAPIITIGSMAFAFGASLLIGVLAGLIPALKAARMNVIQSLRYD